ncbi:MAG TPA: archaemetzincin [Myxococcota bacterium]|nr:archaemetzincin [Myxococcota bacterium]HRY95546.1 archaemetzincin [Myxococcota bacterium]HSA21701.1 archaemetzincin [Myxococcota bacterium]
MAKRVLAAVLALAAAGLGAALWLRSGPPPLEAAAPAESPAEEEAPAPVGFRVPDEAERLYAIGPFDGLAPATRALLTPDPDYLPIDAPGPSDWLARFDEPRETFAEFAAARNRRPEGARRKIYLQPIGEFPEDGAPPLEALREYAQAVFQLETLLLPPLDPGPLGVTSRTHPHTHKPQLLAPQLIEVLVARLPADAFCLLGLTMTDLYPEPSWNFVFGEASPADGVGVFSFARYDPAFFGKPRGPGHAGVLLKRSLSVLAHEAAHLFGLGHCVYFQCLVCGSNSLDEADRRPIHLCPVCLRKLAHAIGFEPLAQHRALRRFYTAWGMDFEADFMLRRLRRAEAAE